MPWLELLMTSTASGSEDELVGLSPLHHGFTPPVATSLWFSSLFGCPGYQGGSQTHLPAARSDEGIEAGSPKRAMHGNALAVPEHCGIRSHSIPDADEFPGSKRRFLSTRTLSLYHPLFSRQALASSIANGKKAFSSAILDHRTFLVKVRCFKKTPEGTGDPKGSPHREKTWKSSSS